jgi:hypothetical protein
VCFDTAAFGQDGNHRGHEAVSFQDKRKTAVQAEYRLLLLSIRRFVSQPLIQKAQIPPSVGFLGSIPNIPT